MARRIVWWHDAARCGLFGICGCDDADRFDLQLPRETKQQASIGTQLIKTSCCQVTWSFSKRVPDKWFACRYLRYQQPIYPRLYQKGVMRSSLDNVYWQKNFWQADESSMSKNGRR